MARVHLYCHRGFICKVKALNSPTERPPRSRHSHHPQLPCHHGHAMKLPSSSGSGAHVHSTALHCTGPFSVQPLRLCLPVAKQPCEACFTLQGTLTDCPPGCPPQHVRCCTAVSHVARQWLPAAWRVSSAGPAKSRPTQTRGRVRCGGAWLPRGRGPRRAQCQTRCAGGCTSTWP